eukprot:2072126-Rhodomonas_salina.3
MVPLSSSNREHGWILAMSLSAWPKPPLRHNTPLQNCTRTQKLIKGTHYNERMAFGVFSQSIGTGRLLDFEHMVRALGGCGCPQHFPVNFDQPRSWSRLY